jgi:hypothetical protein
MVVATCGIRRAMKARDIEARSESTSSSSKSA